jgi:hypothetical protein
MSDLLAAFEATLVDPTTTETTVENTENSEVVESVNESEATETSNEPEEVENKEGNESSNESEGEKPDGEKNIGPVPYNRFSQKVKETNELKETLKKTQAELTRLQGIKAELDKVIGEAIPTDVPPDEYLEAIVNKGIAKKEAERIAKAQEDTGKQYVQTVIGEYQNNIQEYAKINPEVTEADLHLSSYAEQIPPMVLETLFKDSNAGPIVNDIARSQELLEQIINGNPIDSVVLIAKMSAHYEGVLDNAKAKPSNEPKSVIKPLDKGAVKAPQIPKGAPTGKAGIADKSVNELLNNFRKTGRNPFYGDD